MFGYYYISSNETIIFCGLIKSNKNINLLKAPRTCRDDMFWVDLFLSDIASASWASKLSMCLSIKDKTLIERHKNC